MADTRYTLFQVKQMGWLPPGVVSELRRHVESGAPEWRRRAAAILWKHKQETLNDWREENGGERTYTFFHEDGPLTLTESELVARFGRYWEALMRLASTQTFTVAFDAAHASPETIYAELRARGEYAEGVLTGRVRPRGVLRRPGDAA